MPGSYIIESDVRSILASLGDDITRFADKTVLITGANGFLASYLVDTLMLANRWILRNNFVRVIAVVKEPLHLHDRIGRYVQDPAFRLVVQDIAQPLSLHEPVHFIIHAASKASPRDYLSDPMGTIDANVRGARRLLDAAVIDPVEAFLFMSSGEIYGDPSPEHIPTPETYRGATDWMAQRACYTEAKRFAEVLCMNFWYSYNVPIKIVRPFHVYGPGLRLHDGRVVADFFRGAIEDQSITMLSDGSATRSFCYVADATEAFLRVLLLGRPGVAYNVGSDREEISVAALADLIAGLYEPRIPINYIHRTPPSYVRGSPQRSGPAIDSIRSDLKFDPQVPLLEGLHRLKEWYTAQALLMHGYNKTDINELTV